MDITAQRNTSFGFATRKKQLKLHARDAAEMDNTVEALFMPGLPGPLREVSLIAF